MNGNLYQINPANRLDLAAIRAWNRANERARRAYYAQPNAVTLAIWHGSW